MPAEPIQIKYDRTVGILLKLQPTTFTQPIMREMNTQNDLTISYCQLHKLQTKGPMTLQVDSSNLWKSFKKVNAHILGTTIWSGIGSSVKYARVHEFGFKGIVKVPGHTRKGRPVRAHDRHMVMTERKMVRNSITECLPKYMAGLKAACLRALRGDHG